MIINSNSPNVKKIVSDVVEDAVKYYGEEYREHIIKTIEDTYIYEWTDENLGDLLGSFISKYKKPQIDFYNEIQDEVDGLYIKSDKGPLAIVKAQKDELLFKANLIHEVFGHGVCRRKNSRIKIYDNSFLRDGISYANLRTKKFINRELNEGFVEGIAMDIMNESHKGYEKKDKFYQIGQKVFRLMKEKGFKKQIINIMIDGETNIKDLYNQNTPIDEWSILSSAADELNDEVVDQCLDSFSSRMK